MNPLIQFFNVILYQPFLNALVLLYLYLPGNDFGLAIIILTLLIKLALFPSTRKSLKSQRAMALIQPKVKEIQSKFKDDKQQQSIALMELYKKEGISPASGCLPLLLQLPILIALYQVFVRGLNPDTLNSALYSFVKLTEPIKPMFLGFFDLAKPFSSKVGEITTYYWPVLVLALIAAAAQFVQGKMSSASLPKNQSKDKKPDFATSMQKQMLYLLPLLTIFIIVKFGSVIGLYWLTSSLFGIAEQYLIKNKKSKSDNQPPATINN